MRQQRENVLLVVIRGLVAVVEVKSERPDQDGLTGETQQMSKLVLIIHDYY